MSDLIFIIREERRYKYSDLFEEKGARSEKLKIIRNEDLKPDQLEICRASRGHHLLTDQGHGETFVFFHSIHLVVPCTSTPFVSKRRNSNKNKPPILFITHHVCNSQFVA